jgi:predicted ATPase
MDDERKMSFEAASQFGDALRAQYEQLGYVLIVLPCLSVEERAEFLLNSL